MAKATILIPTFNHGVLLEFAVRCAQQQTVTDVEIFIVGDGVPTVTRELVTRLAAQDQRLTFFDHPKGPRHGEIYRHQALQQATGEIVSYMCDDDLYFPDHVEQLLKLLEHHDFAHSLPVEMLPDGIVSSWSVNLDLPPDRHLLLSGENRIPLGCAGHQLDFYRRLPYGWRTTPLNTHTDLYMWQQMLGVPGVRCVSGMLPTNLHFPESRRGDLNNAQRLTELKRWFPLTQDEHLRGNFERQVLAFLAKDRAGWSSQHRADLAHLRHQLRQYETGQS